MTPSSRPSVDPRVERTTRDVIDTSARLLLEHGWDAVTHTEVARASGYSRATLYAHWPTQIDLVRDSVERICDISEHPRRTGDLRQDVRAALLDFARDLEDGQVERLLASVIQRARHDSVVDGLRALLYETGTRPLRTTLEGHVDPSEVETLIEVLTGTILARVSYAGLEASEEFVDSLIEKVLPSSPR